MKKIYILIICIGIAFFAVSIPYINKINILKKSFVEKEKTGKKPTKASPQRQKPFTGKNNLKANAIKYGAIAASISAVQTVTVQGGGNAVPGGQLNYSFILSNAGNEALGVTFTDQLIADLTLVPGSLKSTPIVQNDLYQSIGNVGITVPVDNGVLFNDNSPTGEVMTAAVATGTTSGTLNLAANGSFTYTPNAGFVGNDSFTYTVTTGTTSSTGTVTIQVSNMIWFVNPTIGASGTGTLQSPFKNMSNVAGTAAGNTIFVYAGSPTGAITLLNSQKLVGQGATVPLVGAGSISGITVPVFSNTLPTTSGTRPTWSHTNTALTLASDNDIEGIDIATSGGTSITGSSVGALKIKEVALNNTNGQALQLGAGGVLNIIFDSISSANGAKGISVNNSTGSFQVIGSGTSAGSGGAITNKTTRGIELINCTNVTLKNMNFANANTTDGAVSSPTDNTGANAAIFAQTVNVFNLDNIQMNTSVGNANAQHGISLNGVSNFNLANSTITRCGTSDDKEACIFAVNTSGINTISNSTLSKASRITRWSNSNTNMSLRVTGSSFNDTRTFHDSNTLNAAGQSGILFQGMGSSQMSLDVKGACNFLRIGSQGVNVLAEGSANVNADVLNSTFNSTNATLPAGEDFGLGTVMEAAGSSIIRFNVKNNTITGRGGNLIGFGTLPDGMAKMEGTVEGNIVNYNYVAAVSNNGGYGIDYTHLSGNTDSRVKINNNILTGFKADGVLGISSTIQGGKAHVICTNNNITHQPVANMAASYAIRISVTVAGASGCARVASNNVTNNTNASGYAQMRASVAGTSFDIEGSGILAAPELSIWNFNTNTPSISSNTSPTFISSGGAGTRTLVAAGTCLAPTNDMLNLRLAADETITSESNSETLENSIVEAERIINESGINTDFGVNKNLTLITNSNTNKSSNSKVQSGETITVNGSGSGFSLPTNKTTTITFSATINNPTVACDMTNIASISGSNFSTANSNSTSVPLIIPPIDGGSTISAASVCSGGTISLTAICPVGSTLNWYNASTGGSIVSSVSPYNPTNITVGTDYYASCTIGACESVRTLVGSVTVNALPDATISAVDEVCQGSPLSLSAPNVTGSIYNWTGNGVDADNSATNLASPNTAGSQLYAVTVTDANSCIATSSKTVTVNAKPSVTASASQTICKGESASLIATCDAPCAADTYTWNPGAIAGQSVSVSPIATQTYTLVASNSVTGCVSNPVTTDVNVTPSTLPNVYTTITQDIGTSTQFVDNCVYLSKIEPKSGSANPIGGSVTASVWLESSGLPFSFVGSTFVFVPRHYEITPSTNPTTSEGTISLYFTQADFNAYNANNAVKLPQNFNDIANAANFQIVKYAGSAPNGIPTSGIPIIIPTSGTFNDGISGCTLNWNSTKGFWEATFPVTGFSDFFVKTSSVALPINLISFTGKNTENGNELKWKTANEKAFDGFEIQKSIDSKAFESIGNVKGNQSENYNYLDIIGNTNSQSYYRLKMIDIDGKYTYSKIISIENEAEKALVGNAYPNPSIDQIFVDIITVEKGNWQIEIYDITGKIVDTEKRTLEKGLNKVLIQNLIKGVNFINFKNNEFKVVRKVIKQ